MGVEEGMEGEGKEEEVEERGEEEEELCKDRVCANTNNGRYIWLRRCEYFENGGVERICDGILFVNQVSWSVSKESNISTNMSGVKLQVE